MTRALVLSGGGARGAFQVGMLRELIVEQGLDFQVIRGVSVGSLNAAFLAQAPTGDDAQHHLAEATGTLERIWREEIRGNRSVFGRRAGFLGMVAGADSLYSLRPLEQLIDRNISAEAIRAGGRNFAVGTVSLVTGRYEEWDAAAIDPAQFARRLIASASIPVIFPAVDLPDERDLLVDGGVRNITPLASAFEAGADEIYVLLTSRLVHTEGALPVSSVEPHDYDQWRDNWLGTRVSGLRILERTLELLTDEIYLGDIRGAVRWNEVAGAVAELDAATEKVADLPAPVDAAIGRLRRALRIADKRPARLHVLAPRRWFDESRPPGRRNPAIAFDPDLIDRAIEHGREVARDRGAWVWTGEGASDDAMERPGD